MAILIGVWESILILFITAFLTTLVFWTYWRRRANALLEKSRERHKGELAAFRQTHEKRQQTEMQHMIREFKHQASHCLRPIKDNLDLISRETQERADGYGPESTRLVEKSLKEVKHYEWRLTRLIENMAFVSRLGASDFSLRFSEIKLDAIVSDVVHDFRDAAERKGIRLAWWTRPEDLPRIAANDESLRQLFINLIDNAIKYSGENDEIDIALEAKEEKNVIYVRVSDTGPGIPREDFDSLFLPGYTVEGARGRKPKSGGQGLGLYIVRQIVEKHDGTIEVTSELGKGTTFTITLPIQRN